MCERIKFILQRIELIEDILKNNKISVALSDEKILRPAILMHLMQIGESLNSLSKKFPEVIEKYNLENEVKGAYSVRNFIAHDYEGVNLAIVESVLRNNLMILKEKMLKVTNEC